MGPATRLLFLAALTMPSSVALAEAPAETPPALESYRELTRVAPKRTDCVAGKDAQEIVVCGRRQQNLRYRLPLPVYDPERMAAANVRTERFALTAHRTEGGSGSCSTVGPNGALGCVTRAMREREEAGDGPGLIATALTYLDPDE